MKKETVEENFYNLCDINDDDYKKHIKAIKKFDNLISSFKDDLEDLLKEVKE